MTNIKGMDPYICTHQITLEDDAKPIRQMQCRLNPAMKEVFKTKVLKLLNIGIIYPIGDSKWISPIYIFPIKIRIIVVRNEDGEKVSTRSTMNWHMYIDYLNLT